MAGCYTYEPGVGAGGSTVISQQGTQFIAYGGQDPVPPGCPPPPVPLVDGLIAICFMPPFPSDAYSIVAISDQNSNAVMFEAKSAEQVVLGAGAGNMTTVCFTATQIV